MHKSAHDKMKACIERHIPSFNKPEILDFGSRQVANQKSSHKTLFEPYDCNYRGCDVVAGPNVDIVMPEPYTIPLEDNSIDIIITGQVIEHVPYFWASFMELARVLKEGGVIFCTAPSRGHLHSPPYDCWRFHPDGYKAMAVFAGLHLREVSTDFAPTRPNSKHFDYSGIQDYHYWGDTFGVFQKTQTYNEKEVGPARKAILAWANKVSDVHGINEISNAAPSLERALCIKHAAFDVWFPSFPDVITPRIISSLSKGYYEAKEARALLKYAKKGARILELGAGLGFMASIATQIDPAAYVAVEADPRLIPVMKATHRINEVENVLVHNCAVTNDKEQLETGFIELQMGKEFWGSSIKPKTGSGKYVRVETVSFSSYLANLNPDTLVIDIEGAEVDLFENADLSNVNLIILEAHPSVTGADSVDRMIKLLDENGLKIAERGTENHMIIFVRK